MKRFALFGYEDYEAGGGIHDLMDVYETPEEAREAAEKCALNPFFNCHILYIGNGKLTTVDQGASEKGGRHIKWDSQHREE